MFRKLAATIYRLTAMLLMLPAGWSAAQDDGGKDQQLDASIRKAIAYLEREVPRWSPENGCFSCHNNGDGARALLIAQRFRWPVDRAALADTTAWLARPGRWQDNGGEGEFNDHQLAAIHFGATLREAVQSKVVPGLSSLVTSGQLIAGHQKDDGSWQVNQGALVAGPITYGDCLATAACIQTLESAGADEFAAPIAKARRWLGSVKRYAMPDLAGILIGLAEQDNLVAQRQRRRCLDLIRTAQADDGGWGPFANHRTEPFDTAIVLVALANLPPDDQIADLIRRGRRHLLQAQTAGGSWIETTRPTPTQSYSQRISTTAWATIALIVTHPRANPRANANTKP